MNNTNNNSNSVEAHIASQPGQNFLNTVAAQLKWGEITITVRNGKPAMVKIVKDIKLTEN